MPTFFRASLALVPAFSFALACTSTNPSVDAGPKPQVCPSTIGQATTPGAGGGDAGGEGTTNSCHVPGYICVIGFACPPYIQQAECTCNVSGTFDCIREADKSAIPAGSDVTNLCITVTGDAGVDQCPTDKTMADGTSCKNAGQVCSYVGVKCTGDPVARTDTCQCVGGNANDAGQGVLSWACDINSCN